MVMEREPFKLIVVIPEVPLRSLDAQENSDEKFEALQEEIENQEIVIRPTLNQN